MRAAFILILSFVITFVLIRLLLTLSSKNGIGLRADAGRMPENISPRLGGICIFAGFLTGIALILSNSEFSIMESQVVQGVSQFTIYLISLMTIFILGLIDDLKGLNAWKKLPVEVLVASILFFNGFNINLVTLPFGSGMIVLPGTISIVITILWIVGITNAMNLVDGIDGLAGGIALIASVSFIILSLLNGRPEFALVSLSLIGPLIAFMIFNFYPSKLFMGDSGSLFLGFFLATSSLKASSKASFGISFMVPIIILFIPILDTSLSFFRRVLRGKNPFRHDLEHIHHKLIENGHNEKRAFFIIIGWTIVFSVIGILSTLLPKSLRLVLALVVILLGIFLVFYFKYLKADFFSRIFTFPKNSDKNIIKDK